MFEPCPWVSADAAHNLSGVEMQTCRAVEGSTRQTKPPWGPACSQPGHTSSSPAWEKLRQESLFVENRKICHANTHGQILMCFCMCNMH